MSFRIGQKVVCVDDSISNADGERELVRGQMYVVAWAGIFDHPQYGKYPGVSVEGITRDEPLHPELPDVPFAAFRFAPVVENKPDISIFTALLNPSRRELVSSVIGEDINTLLVSPESK